MLRSLGAANGIQPSLNRRLRGPMFVSHDHPRVDIYHNGVLVLARNHRNVGTLASPAAVMRFACRE